MLAIVFVAVFFPLWLWRTFLQISKGISLTLKNKKNKKKGLLSQFVHYIRVLGLRYSQKYLYHRNHFSFDIFFSFLKMRSWPSW